MQYKVLITRGVLMLINYMLFFVRAARPHPAW